MKVLDLQCSRRHSFEGWFTSEDDFRGQLARGLVACPICADRQITKKLSAPRLNLGYARELAPGAGSGMPDKGAAGQTAVPPGPVRELQAAWLRVMRRIVAKTEDVGEAFADEVREMHYGETQARPIRGVATPQETVALLEEGIPVLPLPDPVKETLQ